MLQTYLKTAFRNLVKKRKHSLLNILGLSVAIGACIIVFLVIQYETSYDKHLKNYKNIYQVVIENMQEYKIVNLWDAEIEEIESLKK